METNITDRFYVPKIEEFHVGFEYEENVKDSPIAEIDSGWQKYICGKSFIFDSDTMGDEIKEGIIRVKYLDREDIESFGFKPSFDEPEEWFLWKGVSDSYQLYYDDKIENKKLGIGITIYNEDSTDILFNGYIKNKSELKKIMKQVGVK